MELVTRPPLSDAAAAAHPLAAFDRLSRPVWVVDATVAGLWWANRAALDLFEAPALEALVARDLCPLPPAVAARLDRGLPPLPPDQPQLRESIVVRQARRSVILDCVLSPLSIEGGRLGLLVEGTPHDERPSAAPSARRAEEALQATGVMVSMFDLEQRPVYENAAARAAYDGVIRAGVGGSFRDRFVDRDEADHAWATLRRGRVYRCEGRFRTAHGERWHAMEARQSQPHGQEVADDPREAAPVIVVTEYDVTEYVLGRGSLQETVDRLARSNAELEQFAWIASHDLREPLRRVISYMSLLERHAGAALDDTAREYMAFACDGARRLDTLTRDLTEYAAIGRNDRPVGLVDMAALAEEVRAAYADDIAERQAVLTVAPLPTVQGDAVELRQLLSHLLSNALKYGPAGAPPRITITADRQDCAWVFAVIDNGIGIDPRYFTRIFQIFQRLHGPEAYSGTGVGLALCRKVVERHGGRIWIESAPGKGAAVFFTLPAD